MPLQPLIGHKSTNTAWKAILETDGSNRKEDSVRFAGIDNSHTGGTVNYTL